jgi:predicted O-methyltransferase YrrM
MAEQTSAPDAASSPRPTAAAWAFAESWLEEDEALRTARARGIELGCLPVSGSTAALLGVLAAAVQAKNVVEVGTGTGLSAAGLFRGMDAEGVLTSIDEEAENQRAARELLTSMDIDHVRIRLIAGRGLEVLARLTDGAYDLAFINGDAVEYPAMLHQVQRLLRPGGMVVFAGVQPESSSGGRTPEALAIAEVLTTVRDADHWLPALLPVGSGLLAAVLRPSP